MPLPCVSLSKNDPALRNRDLRVGKLRSVLFLEPSRVGYVVAAVASPAHVVVCCLCMAADSGGCRS